MMNTFNLCVCVFCFVFERKIFRFIFATCPFWGKKKLTESDTSNDTL